MKPYKIYVTCLAFSAICCLFMGCLFFPGLISQDSVDSLAQALGAKPLSDWHPVFFTYLLKLTSFGTSTYFILLQTTLIGLFIGLSASLIVLSTKASLFGALALCLWFIFSAPGLSLILTITKDSIFNYALFCYMCVLFFFCIKKDISTPKLKILLLISIFIASTVSLTRHNGFTLLWPLTLTCLLVLYWQKRLSGKTPILAALLLLSGHHLIKYSLSQLSAPGQKLEEQISLVHWTLRADYTMLYLTKKMGDPETREFESLLDTSKIVNDLRDTYFFTWSDLPLQNGNKKEDFFEKARIYLFSHRQDWMAVKFLYGYNLISSPPEHAIIFSGDLSNRKAQADLNSSGKNNFVLEITNSKRLGIIQSMSSFFGIASYDSFSEKSAYFIRIWTLVNWIFLFFISFCVAGFFEFISTRSTRITLLFGLFSAVTLCSLWIPYIALSLTNQARYFYITILISKASIAFAILWMTYFFKIFRKNSTSL